MLRNARVLCLGVVGWVVTSGGANAAKIDFQLRAVTTSTAAVSITTLPSNITDVGVGESFFLEVWMKDLGNPSTGISGAYLDIAYDTSLVDATTKDHGATYTTFTEFSAIDDAAGLIDEFGGSYLGLDRPGETDWVKLGSVTCQRTAAGPITFTPQPSDDEISRFSAGSVAWEDVTTQPLTLPIPEPTGVILLLLGTACWAVSGRRRGAACASGDDRSGSASIYGHRNGVLRSIV